MAELTALSRTPDEEIEKALLIRYRQHHDDSVFREIHDHFHPELRNFIRGHLLSAFDAESDTQEILQETFLDLYCYRDQLQPATQLRAALYAIAKNNVDDQPRPGTSVFHATFSLADQRSGRFAPLAIPRPSGPRNCGQCCGDWPHSATGAPPARRSTARTGPEMVFRSR